MSKVRLIRLAEVLSRTGYTRSSWYREMETDTECPRPIKLGKRCIGFVEADIDAYISILIERSRG